MTTLSRQMQLQLGIILPVWNVERTIGEVLTILRNAPEMNRVTEILIIDNKSADTTLGIILKQLREYPDFGQKVTVLGHLQNYGYGNSIKTGFEYFQRKQMDYVMILHGDLQEDPQKILHNLLAEYDANPSTDFILTSRFSSQSSTKGYSVARTFGNYFFNWMTRWTTGLKISDAGGAILMLRTSVLKRIPFLSLSGAWHFHPQLNILLFSEPNLTIKEIPLNWADSLSKSSLNLMDYGIKLFKMLVRYWYLRVVVRKTPREIFDDGSEVVSRQHQAVTAS